mmetsp:Transcript_18934/g.56528  ORF Transcript_18934/g.56528 Transcript_18934/m.56528 type:complete len:290 (+) Transcript_18934:851-1720(+)
MESCVPLFTRTARFDIVPNRFGILGQFGPDRKLTLSTTKVSGVIGTGGKVLANASIELEVYLSNASHPLKIFEYTKENNLRGININVPTPAGGWKEHTWHEMALPIDDSHYNHPASTPWEHMDRLELYYADPSPFQPRGVDYVRIRNVYLRSTQSFRNSKARPQGAAGAQTTCKELKEQQTRSTRTTQRKLTPLLGGASKLGSAALDSTAALVDRVIKSTMAEPEPELRGDRETTSDDGAAGPKWLVPLLCVVGVVAAAVIGCNIKANFVASQSLLSAYTPKAATSARD